MNRLGITFGLLLAASPGSLFTGQAFSQPHPKSTVVVKEFTVANGVQWPYSTQQLQKATVAELVGEVQCLARSLGALKTESLKERIKRVLVGETKRIFFS